MSETTGTAVKGENVNGNAVRLINDELWRQDVEPWCEPVDGALLVDMFIAFHLAKAEKVFSRDLVRELNLQEDRPWVELRRDRVLTEHWLARQLRPYGVRPRTVWIGERSSKGYVLEEMLDAFRRYVPRSEIDDLRGQTRPVAEEENKGVSSWYH